MGGGCAEKALCLQAPKVTPHLIFAPPPFYLLQRSLITHQTSRAWHTILPPLPPQPPRLPASSGCCWPPPATISTLTISPPALPPATLRVSPVPQCPHLLGQELAYMSLDSSQLAVMPIPPDRWGTRCQLSQPTARLIWSFDLCFFFTFSKLPIVAPFSCNGLVLALFRHSKSSTTLLFFLLRRNVL